MQCVPLLPFPLGIVTRRKGSPFGSSEAIVNGSDCRGRSHLKILAGEERARLRGRIRSTDYTPDDSVRTVHPFASVGNGLDHSAAQLRMVNGTETRRCDFEKMNTASRGTKPSGAWK